VKDPTFWILARSSGLTAYVLLTLSVLGGLVVKSRPLGRRLRQPTAVDLHRFLALLGLGAIAIHGAALVLDKAVPIPLQALVIPGASPYRPIWVGMGVVAAELMVLVYFSFALRRRIGAKNWRRLHWATYVIFAGATIHGITSGTDSTHPWALLLYIGAIGLIATAATWRALTPPLTPATERRVT
jgi:methionine sulfoxide reductase heme-binding subunit